MSQNNDHDKYLIAKFQRFIAKGGGGIFTTKTRERLLGVRVASGRDRTKNDFRYDVRNRVKNALVDLELFVETADEEQIDQVLTRYSLEPIVSALFDTKYIWSDHEPNNTKAEIADMVVRWGLSYLGVMAKKNITLSHDRTMKEALDLSYYLLQTIKGEPYHGPVHVGLE